MVWQQIYNPFGNMIISTLLAAVPVVVMLVCLGFLHMKAHLAAGLGLLAAVLVAVFAFVFLGERPSGTDWLGIGLVAAGVLVLAFRR